MLFQITNKSGRKNTGYLLIFWILNGQASYARQRIPEIPVFQCVLHIPAIRFMPQMNAILRASM